MHVGSAVVTLSTGRQAPLSDLYREKPLGLVFLRHFGCIFCREQVSALRTREDLNIAFVSMGRPEETAEFRAMLKSPHPFVCDPEAKLYEEFGLERGSVRQMFGAQVWKRGFQAASKGHSVGRPVGDPWRMPGEFVINTKGRIVWEHRPRHAGDNSPVSALEQALKQATEVAELAELGEES
jgi:hypothetical protein